MTATFTPPTDTSDRDCACGAVLPTVADVFLHTCPEQPTPAPEPVAPADWAATHRGDPARRNRYATTCADCGQRVPEQEGSLTREGDRWAVRHWDDPCPEAPVHQANHGGTPMPDVPAGYYAVPSGGHNDLVFLRVDRPTEGRWTGYTFLRTVVGGHPDRRVPRAQVRGYLEAILQQGATKAAQTYGREIGRCGRCNRHLTDETSRARGLGPDCAGMVGA
jgi:hypothetical protein